MSIWAAPVRVVVPVRGGAALSATTYAHMLIYVDWGELRRNHFFVLWYQNVHTC